MSSRADSENSTATPAVSTRRSFLSTAASVAAGGSVLALAAIPTPSFAGAPDRRALEAYASWLFMERRILCGELWPHMGKEAERYNNFDNAGAGWHFRGDGDWSDLPQPSTRAAAVLDLVGVDWRQPKPDMGLNHEDSGHRPELPPGWPAIHPDARLFELEEKIFEHKEAADAFNPEADRLSDIWTMENKRLSVEYEATLTFEEQRAIIDAMPEFKEYMRLRELQMIQREAVDDLVKQMWEIKALTPEGRRAKVVVLLGCVMEDDEWRRVFHEPCEPFDVTRARDLLIEFVGGEPAAQLRDQFA